MSRSFTVKQSTVRPEMRKDKVEVETQTSPNTQPQDSKTQRVQRKEAYTVIRPDEKKRNKLLEVAKKEEESARKQREAKGSTPIKMTPQRVGGDCKSREEVYEQRQRESERKARRKEIEIQEKREHYQKEKKEREDKEIQKRRDTARDQAEKNTRKEAQKREEHRRQNVEYFQNKFAGCSISSQDEKDHTSGHSSHTSHQPMDDPFTQLCHMYPDYEPAILADILHSCGGSIQHARTLLQ